MVQVLRRPIRRLGTIAVQDRRVTRQALNRRPIMVITLGLLSQLVPTLNGPMTFARRAYARRGRSILRNTINVDVISCGPINSENLQERHLSHKVLESDNSVNVRPIVQGTGRASVPIYLRVISSPFHYVMDVNHVIRLAFPREARLGRIPFTRVATTSVLVCGGVTVLDVSAILTTRVIIRHLAMKIRSMKHAG